VWNKYAACFADSGQAEAGCPVAVGDSTMQQRLNPLLIQTLAENKSAGAYMRLWQIQGFL